MHCWICYQNVKKTNLCSCDNDFSYCHYSCLNKWMLVSGITKCQMCKEHYKLPFYYNIIQTLIYFYNFDFITECLYLFSII